MLIKQNFHNRAKGLVRESYTDMETFMKSVQDSCKAASKDGTLQAFLHETSDSLRFHVLFKSE